MAPPRPHTAGFTLIELLLVLVLLVIVAGFTAGAFDGTMSYARLNDGSQKLRTAWSDARGRAIASGDRVVFVCQIGAATYQLSSYNDLQALGEESSAVEERTLPEGLVFRAVQAAPRDTASAHAAQLGGRQGDWSLPVVFEPDGTSYDAVVVLEGAGEQQLELTLRGLTCTTTVRPLDEGERVR